MVEVFGRRARGLVVALAWLAGAGAAGAQSAPPGLDQPSYLTPAPLSADNPLTRRTREYSRLAIGDWLFNPDLTIGAVYNDNLVQAQSGRIGAAGLRARGEVTGVRDSGVARTSVYGDLDVSLYPGRLADSTYDGRVGVAQIWALQPSLSVKAGLEFDQLTYPTYGGQVVAPGGAVASLVAPQRYRQAQASTAVQKAFGRFFIGLSLNETATLYDALSTSAGSIAQDYRNSAVTTLTQRAGYWVSPLLYAYGETAENAREYVRNSLASHGYRAVAGLGSDRIGLFRGEVYGGYQQQVYSALLAPAKSPVFGGKLYWYPTRALTLTGALDESFSDSNNPTPSNPLGNPARVTATQIKAEYQLARTWSAQGWAEYDSSRFLGISRLDDTWMAGLGVDRALTRNLDVKVDYKYVRNVSDAQGASFVNNILGAGAIYKF